MFQKYSTKLITIFLLSVLSNLTMAHLNVAPEDAIAVGDGSREYKEGSSAFVDINISHDCSNEEGKHFATTGVAVLLPNGMGIQDTYTSDFSGEKYDANAVMGVKQRVNNTFQKNIVVKGDVQPFYNHGIKTTDVRALKWFKGKVDNDYYENLEFKVKFPKIDPDSCVAKIKMYFPSMQYCKNDYKIGWINTADSKYGLGDEKTRITDTYAAYLNVVRTSDLPESCGEGYLIEIQPSVEDINYYLDKVGPGRHF